MDSSHPIKKDWQVFFFLLLLYCLFRIPILLSHYDPFLDELDRGAIAVELLEGNPLPFWAYSTQAYAGGTFFTGLYTAPFFALFGKSLMVAKLVPFCFHLLTLLAWFLILRSYFSSKQIFWVLLFLVLSPPGITQYMLTNRGLYFDAILWMASSLLLFREFLEGKLSEIKAGILLGLLGGITSWLMLPNFLIGFVILIYLAWMKDKSINKRIFYSIYTSAFVIGFSPWVYTNWKLNWQAFDLIGEMTHIPLTLSYFFRKVEWIFRYCLPSLFQFGTLPKFADGFLTKVFTLSYLFSLVFLMVNWRWVIRQWRQPLNLVSLGLVFQILLLGLTVVGAGAIKEYYLFPLVPFVGINFVAVGIRFGQWGGWRKRAGISFAALFLAAGVFGNARLVDWNQMGSTRLIQGYSYAQWLGHLPILQEVRNFSGYREMFVRFVSGHPPKVQRIFYQTIPKDSFAFSSETSLQNALDFIIKTDAGFQPILFEKLGFQWGLDHPFDPQRWEDFLKQRDWDEPAFLALHRGAVQSLGILEDEQEKKRRSLAWCEFVPEKAKGACYEGLGWMGINPEDLKNHPITPHDLFSFFKGHGYHLAGIFRHEPLSLVASLRALSPSEREGVLLGIQEEISWEEDEYLQGQFFKKIGLKTE